MLPQPCPRTLQRILFLPSVFKHKKQRYASSFYVHHGACFFDSLSRYLIANLNDCGDRGHFRQLFLEGLSGDQSNHVPLWNSLINGFIRLGELRKSLSLYVFMRHHCKLTPSLHTYVGLLKVCAQLKDLEKGSQMHDEISSMGLVNSDPFVGAALVDMYVKCNSFHDALYLLTVLPVHNVVARNVLISRYVQNKRFLDALDYFEVMKMEGVFPNAVTFSCVLKACSNTGDIVKGVEIHAEVCRKGLLRTNCYLGNGLIEMYAKCRKLTRAQDVFKELLVRNVVSWTVLIEAFAMNDHGEEAINYFKEMQIQGFSPNAITFACALKACGSIGAIDNCAEIYAEISRQGLVENDPFLSSALVDFYAKWGFLNAAQEIFDINLVREVVIWTALVSGYTEHGLGHEALGRIERMKAESISPNVKTYVSALKGCGNIRSYSKGIQIHASVGKSVFLETDLFLGSALVGMYSNCGMVASSQRVFDMLPDRNVVTWSALIMGYAKNKCDKDALNYFHLMRENGVHPNEVTIACTLTSCGNIEILSKMHDEILMNDTWKNNFYISTMVIDVYAKCGSLVKAREALETLVVRNTVLWNVVISGYIQHCYHEEALKCLEYMELEGVSPNTVTVCCILKACGNIGSLKIAEKLHVEVARKGLLQRDVFAGSALVDVYSKCGYLVKAKDVFDMLPIRNRVTWTALISGYSQAGDIESAIITLTRMINEGGQKPDQVTFVSILNAFSAAGYVDEGHTYLQFMIKHFGMPPSINHYACIVDMIGRAGQLDYALAMITEIPFLPDSAMWLSVMSACHNWGNVYLAKHAFEQAVQLNAMDPAAFVSMYNILAQAKLERASV